jgi:peptide deformylase
MAVLPVRIYPDPVLRAPTEDVSEFDDAFRAFLRDMWDTMEAKDGVGLAAPQVGVSKRVIVVVLKGERHVLVNPRIIEAEGEQVGEEGCLSFPGIFEKIARPLRVVVEALDENGDLRTITGEEFAARALSHEIDHINGKLLIDHVSPMKRHLIKKRLQKRKE